jgi:protocatechuate 3,4-dioxygenase beta subunit
MVHSSNAPPVAPSVTDSYARAVQLAETDATEAVAALRLALEQEAGACQRALLDPAFATLRDTREFRAALKDAVIKHKVSSLTLAPPNEPGKWLEIEGTVVDADNTPIPGARVTVFGTAKDGRYHPTIEGDETPRLFGYLLADDKGRFSFRTIRPGPYPNTRDAEHFHIWASVPGKRMAMPHYSVLDDDPLLQEPQNAEQRGEAIRIAMKPAGDDGIAHGTIVLPMR